MARETTEQVTRWEKCVLFFLLLLHLVTLQPRSPIMNIGTSVPLPAYTIDPAFMAQKAEALGFESIWYAEHPAVPVHSASPFPATGGEIPWTYSHFTDPYMALARLLGSPAPLNSARALPWFPSATPSSWPRRSPALTCSAAAASCSALAQAGCGRKPSSWVATSSTAGRRPGKPSRS